MEEISIILPGLPPEVSAAVRRPRCQWGRSLVALLGPTVRKGFVWEWTERTRGTRAFDAQYFSPSEAGDGSNEKSAVQLSRFNRAAQSTTVGLLNCGPFLTLNAFSFSGGLNLFAWSWPFCAVQLCSSIRTCPLDATFERRLLTLPLLAAKGRACGHLRFFDFARHTNFSCCF